LGRAQQLITTMVTTCSDCDATYPRQISSRAGRGNSHTRADSMGRPLPHRRRRPQRRHRPLPPRQDAHRLRDKRRRDKRLRDKRLRRVHRLRGSRPHEHRPRGIRRLDMPRRQWKNTRWQGWQLRQGKRSFDTTWDFLSQSAAVPFIYTLTSFRRRRFLCHRIFLRAVEKLSFAVLNEERIVSISSQVCSKPNK
jgi:hypothetical protein